MITPAFLCYLRRRQPVNKPIAPDDNRLDVNKHYPLMWLLLGGNFEYMWPLEIVGEIDQWLARLEAASRANHVFPALVTFS